MFGLPANASIILSHIQYRVNDMEDHALQKNACIAPNCDEDSQKLELRSDCSMCFAIDVRVPLSTAALFKWRVTNVNEEAFFYRQDH